MKGTQIYIATSVNDIYIIKNIQRVHFFFQVDKEIRVQFVNMHFISS